MLQKPLRQVIIRKAIDADISMMQVFIFTHGINPWNFLPEDGVKAHLSGISSQMVQAYLAEVNGECIGFASFYLGLPPSCQKYEENQENQVAYLGEIVVHHDYVGQGIGSKLINTLKEHLIANNITRLYAERHADNISSSALMKKTGFKVIDEYDDEQRRPTGTKKTVVTRLELS
ncbi:MAG TPA: GNAT family N-acetyltransferase [Gammaproteobacteria bacterium]|nr:GNAT family N-acetyltransferase [Gammaproteobacteria bacterium]